MSEAALYFVYVLRNPAGVFYTGIAKDVDLRLRRHNDGRGARFTRGRGPWSVCHREGPLGHGDALRREAAIKIDRAFKATLRARLAALTRKRPRTSAAKSKSARSPADAARSLDERGPGASGPRAKKGRTGGDRSIGKKQPTGCNRSAGRRNEAP